jgi:hypothetical protein
MEWELKPWIQSGLNACKTQLEKDRYLVAVLHADKLKGMSPKVAEAWIDRFLRLKKTENAYHLSRAKHKKDDSRTFVPPEPKRIEYSSGSINLKSNK